MPKPRAERFPIEADPQHFETGYQSGDPEDVEGALLDDLASLGLWDEYEALLFS